jgi:tetratricopeptide (TPR) repeat protein
MERCDEAEEEYKKALALNPYYPPLHYSYGLLMRKMRRFDEAKVQYTKAMQLDPDIGSKMTETWIILD